MSEDVPHILLTTVQSQWENLNFRISALSPPESLTSTLTAPDVTSSDDEESETDDAWSDDCESDSTDESDEEEW